MRFFKENFKEGGFKIYNILVHLKLRSGQFSVSTTSKYLSKMHDLELIPQKNNNINSFNWSLNERYVL